MRIAAPGQDYYRYQEWKLETLPRGFRLSRISDNVSQTALSVFVSFFPSFSSLSFLSLNSFSSFFDSISVCNTDVTRRGTGSLLQRFSVCMFCGWLFVQTVDTRREVIISLSHLIISANYSPEYSLRLALTSVHGYRQAGVWVQDTLRSSDSPSAHPSSLLSL